MKSLTIKEMARFDLIMGSIILIIVVLSATIPIYQYYGEVKSFLDFFHLLGVIMLYELCVLTILSIAILFLMIYLKIFHFYKDRLNKF